MISLLRFDFDDVAVGPTFAIFAKGQRRIRVDGTTKADLQILMSGRKCRVPALSAPLQQTLIENGLLKEDENILHSRVLCAYVPSRIVTALASRLTLFARPEVMAILAIFAAINPLLFWYMLWRSPITHAAPSMSLVGSIIIAIMLFYTVMLFHELGHAASCLRASGTVGGIRLGWYRGILLMAVDVTSSMQCTKLERAAIAMAGIVWQGAVGTIIVITTLIGWTDWVTGALAAFAITYSNLYSLVPANGNDGSLALLDLCGVKIHEPKIGWSATKSRLMLLFRSLRLIVSMALIHSVYIILKEILT